MSNSKMSSTSPSSSFPSLCIPWVHLNITEERIRNVFEQPDFGEIERIDSVTKTDKNDREHQRVFVHFKSCSENAQAAKAKEMLQAGESIKLVYDDPWFWKVWISKSERPENRKKSSSRSRTAPHIDFGN